LSLIATKKEFSDKKDPKREAPGRISFFYPAASVKAQINASFGIPMSTKTTPTWPILGKLTQQEFLSRYWQKKPLLMKRALFPFPDLITPDEVAGLSCDKRVESRLIMEKGGKTPWELKRGPFKPSLFSKLPKTHWTILVNGVDRFVPQVHGLLDHFSFIPFWRIDDVMISVAYDKGNVGAHVDNFDVFLVQAHGKREWLIEDRPVEKDDFVPGLPIRLLKKFKPTHRWVLEPGDILYLPPRFPHHGIAQGDKCMTVSVGFRAPTVHEVMNGLVSKAMSEGSETLRYSDPDLKAQKPGEISPAAIKELKAAVEKEMLSDSFITDWLGSFTTEPYCDVEFERMAKTPAPAVIKKALENASTLSRAEGARFAYVRGDGGSIIFYANGQRSELGGKVAKVAMLIADQVTIPTDAIRKLTPDAKALSFVASLVGGGLLVFD
jgi:50S ribosomal protein L16 3-hydroxylase